MSSTINSLTTKEYIINHKRAVQRWMQKFSLVLLDRGNKHDDSKLQSPELEWWTKMDGEKRFAYGTKEYHEKMERYKHLFEMHWRNNRHHPEYFEYNFNDMDLIDIIEMLCDWLSYKDKLSYTEASNLVNQQCLRYNFSEELRDLILNTLKNHFIYFGGVFTPETEKTKNLYFQEETKSTIDIKV